jgi:hypothetical protein
VLRRDARLAGMAVMIPPTTNRVEAPTVMSCSLVEAQEIIRHSAAAISSEAEASK